MESGSMSFWVIFSVVAAVIILPSVKILHRMGYSGWWTLSYLFPPLLIVMVWILAFKKWPVQLKQSNTNVLEGEYIPAGGSMSQSDWKEKAGATFGCLGALAFMGYGIAVLIIGWIGIEEELGPWWAFGAAMLAFVLRFTLPITVGAIFGAMYLWDWHWALATLFAMPGLLFMVPALVVGIYETVKGR